MRGGNRRVLGTGIAALAVLVATTLVPQAGHAAPEQSTPGGATASVIPGKWIVSLYDTPQLRAVGVAAYAQTLTRMHGGTVRRVYTTALLGFAVDANDVQRNGLAGDPAVSWVGPDRMMSLAGSQQVPEWGLDRVDQRAGVDSSYSYPWHGGAPATIYVVDTGVRITHREFGGRARHGRDILGNDNDASDCNGHGTQVASVAAGATYGVAKQARVVSVRVADCNGAGPVSAMLAGLDWVMQNAVRPAVVNISLSVAEDPLLDSAVAAMIRAGLPVVAAAGNNNSDASWYSPSGVPQAIVAAASGRDDRPGASSNWGWAVDLYAPGVDIKAGSSIADTATRVSSGTSYAAAFTSGAAALFLGSYPQATPADVEWILRHRGSAGPGGVPLLWVRGNLYESQVSGGSVRWWNANLSDAPDRIRTLAGTRYAGLLQTFAVTEDGRLWHNYQQTNGLWFGWTADFFPFPPNLRSVTPAAGPAGELELFMIDRAGVLHHAYYLAGWHGSWPDFDGSPRGVTSVVAGRGPSGALELFATNANGALYHNWFDGSWHGWTPHFDGMPSGVVSVQAMNGPNGSLEVFAVHSSGYLFHNYLDGTGWHGWTALHGNLFQPVTMVAGVVGGGVLEAFAVGTNGQLYQNFKDGAGWRTWTPAVGSPPAGVKSITAMAGSPTASAEFFLVAGARDEVYHTARTSGGWSQWWKDPGGAPDLARSVVALPGTTGRVEAFIVPANP
jgi:hypothetical protein